MAFHLPYCEAAADEFQMPDGRWFYALRAVVEDSWLLWKHALPAEPQLRRLLNAAAVESITALACALHGAHQKFPDYHRLGSSPFSVGQWWDPSDTTGQFSSGSRVLLRIGDYSASEVQRRLQGFDLANRAISDHYLEISLQTPAAKAADGRS